MKPNNFDLLVIGAGSGGVRASRIAAKHGARVAIVECSDFGGICVNLGCIPKKLFAYASEYHAVQRDAAGFGWALPQATFDWPVLRENKNKEIKRLNHIYEKLLVDAGVHIIHGRAAFHDAHSVMVNEQLYHAQHILIATGTEVSTPELPGKEYAITSDQAFHLETLPKRAIVVGGGYIALEFASIFNGLNVETTLVHRDHFLLRGFDQSVREFAAQEMQKKGVKILLNTQIQKIEKNADSLTTHLNNQTTLSTDLILYAIGRHALTKPLALDKANVALRENGSIIVDDFCQTNVPHIYAVGDVTGGPQLTPLAILQGHLVADNLFANMARKRNSTLVPTAVFCDPNIATVGLTEEQAREQYPDINIYQSTFRALKHTLTGSDEKTLMKLITDKKTDKILGAHMVGAQAGEIIQCVAIAIQCGATKADFDNTLAIHPTSAEEFVLMR